MDSQGQRGGFHETQRANGAAWWPYTHAHTPHSIHTNNTHMRTARWVTRAAQGTLKSGQPEPGRHDNAHSGCPKASVTQVREPCTLFVRREAGRCRVEGYKLRRGWVRTIRASTGCRAAETARAVTAGTRPLARQDCGIILRDFMGKCTSSQTAASQPPVCCAAAGSFSGLPDLGTP